MRVSVHADVSTFRTILSREAIRVITLRLRDRGVRDFGRTAHTKLAPRPRHPHRLPFRRKARSTPTSIGPA